MSDFFISFWQFLESTWQMWGLILGFGLFIVLVEYLFKWIEKALDKRWLGKHKTLEEWKKIDPRKFEKITAIIFEKLGYKTKIIGGAGDWGIDIIATKKGKRTFIQCKRMDRIIPDDVRAFWGSIEDEIKKGKGEKGFFITTGSFTEESREFTIGKPIELNNSLALEKLANQNLAK